MIGRLLRARPQMTRLYHWCLDPAGRLIRLCLAEKGVSFESVESAPWSPHPVRGIGWLCTTLEELTRKTFANLYLAGSLTVIGVIGITSGAVVLVRRPAGKKRATGCRY